MKARIAIAIAAALFCLPLAQAQQAPATTVSPSAVNGVWRAQADGAPYVTMSLWSDDGELTGAIVFYLHIRRPDGSVSSTEDVPEPLLHPHLEGSSLVFEVRHRSSGRSESQPSAPIPFRMQISDGGHAQLVNLDSPGTNAEMVRSDN